MSLLLPTFLQQLSNPEIKTVLLCGCGGGFDFVHSMVLYPELMRLGKNVVIGSYSFGYPEKITGFAPVVFEAGQALVKRVNAASNPPDHYCPEVHLCAFLDERYPDSAPHHVYAYYARAFAVPQLLPFYQQLIAEHAIDAIVMMDGGSDSLMVGDEEGLGDPVEDAVSVATVASLQGLQAKILISVGMGTDRFNHVSDAATLRAVSELIQNSGFLGSISLEQNSAGLHFSRDCIHFIYERQGFRSVISGMILSAADGYHGGEDVPPLLESRLQSGSFYLWAIMAMLWGFEVDKVAKRSLIVDWIQACNTHAECHLAIYQHRAEINLRDIEDFPRHQDARYDPNKHNSQ